MSTQLTHSSLHYEDSPLGWQVLGELQLVIMGTAPDAVVRKWLPVIFGLLKLREDFLDKVIHSAIESISRVMQNESMVEHIHLLVLMPEIIELNNQNWGFFRIEKVRSEIQWSDSDHTIEVYLYQEG